LVYIRESIENRLKDGWFDNIHLESDDFLEPVIALVTTHPKFAGTFWIYSPAIPQVIKTTGRGSLSVRRKKGLSASGVLKLSVGPAIFPSWTKNLSSRSR
jgi:hypothetical protein